VLALSWQTLNLFYDGNHSPSPVPVHLTGMYKNHLSGDSPYQDRPVPPLVMTTDGVTGSPNASPFMAPVTTVTAKRGNHLLSDAEGLTSTGSLSRREVSVAVTQAGRGLPALGVAKHSAERLASRQHMDAGGEAAEPSASEGRAAAATHEAAVVERSVRLPHHCRGDEAHDEAVMQEVSERLHLAISSGCSC
jgi:hypothetical protein